MKLQLLRLVRVSQLQSVCKCCLQGLAHAAASCHKLVSTPNMSLGSNQQLCLNKHKHAVPGICRLQQCSASGSNAQHQPDDSCACLHRTSSSALLPLCSLWMTAPG